MDKKLSTKSIYKIFHFSTKVFDIKQNNTIKNI